MRRFWEAVKLFTANCVSRLHEHADRTLTKELTIVELRKRAYTKEHVS